MKNESYGKIVKDLRIQMGLTQQQVADALEVTPGYISNVENERTAMSLRVLIYYAKLLHISLDSLVGRLDTDYQSTALDRDVMDEISKLSDDQKRKLIQTLQIWGK